MTVTVVLGGGISGLASAYYLRTLAPSKFSKVVILEKSSRFGGWLESICHENNVVYELGPRSVRVGGKVGKNTLKLVEDLNLVDDLIPVTPSNKASQKRFIVHNGKLTVLPLSLKPVFFTVPPFKRPLIWSFLNDVVKPRKLVEDESIHDFISRRVGESVASVTVDPMCRGIVAGSSKMISIRSLFPNFYKAEQEYGSLFRGLMAISKAGDPAPKDVEMADINIRAKLEKWAMWNLQKGVQQLPDSLLDWLRNDENVQIFDKSACSKLDYADNIIKVQTEDGSTYEADHVISTIPSFSLAPVVADKNPNLSMLLSKIPFVNVAVINFEFAKQVSTQEAFGYLVPSHEKSKVLGVVFDSCSFKEHDGLDDIPRSRYTCMMGGQWFEEYFGDADTVDKNELLKIAYSELNERLGIHEEPSNYHVSIQKNCIPQYLVGHHSIINDIKKELKTSGLPLSLTGSSYEGVSVNDVIFNARRTVENLMSEI